jgi:hypothetical protein
VGEVQIFQNRAPLRRRIAPFLYVKDIGFSVGATIAWLCSEEECAAEDSKEMAQEGYAGTFEQLDEYLTKILTI